jgi:predicted nucleic acid-binding protein
MAIAALIDAGPLVAAGSRRDRWRVVSVEFIDGFEGTLHTTWPVLTEACHLTPHDGALRLLKWASRGGVAIHDIPREGIAKIADMMEKYADLPMDLADASLVWLADEIGIRDIATLDERDFATYRLAGGKRFNNLLTGRGR